MRASLNSAPPLAIPRDSTPDRDAAAAACLPRIVAADLAREYRPERAAGGAFASGALHSLILVGALLWSQSVIDPAPEPIAVEVVAEQPAQTGSAPTTESTAAEAPPPTAPPSLAAAPPEAKPAPAAEPLPEPAPTPSAVASPEPTPSPPEPTPSALASPEPSPAPPEPTPSALASPEPSPASPEPTPTVVASPEPVAPPPATEAPTAAPDAAAGRPSTPVATALAEAPPRAEPRPAKPAGLIKPEEPAKPVARAHANPRPQMRTALAQHSASAPAPAATTQAFGAAPGAHAATAAIGDYRNSIFASISAHTRYPVAALDRRAEGVAKVRFSIDDAGRLTAVALAGSAGDLALDTDAPATVRRSAPFGPPPSGAPRDYVVPIRYRPQ